VVTAPVVPESFLLTRLGEPLPGPAAQLRFSPLPVRKGWTPDGRPANARLAAALVLLYPGAHGATLPLTVRRDDLPHHPGQVSLPGGRIDPGEDAAAAALREAEEEIGVPASDVRILGELSPLWVVVSGFVLRTFVGVADGRPVFRPAPHEVAALLEVPIGQLHEPSRLGWSRRVREGVVVNYPHFDLEGHKVWGATAMVLGEFATLFEPGLSPPPLSR
jgi:8-oxo-dGTP pyrophosphatase MutT (NUDIX family)